MAAPSVTFDGTRLTEAESNTDGGSWDKWDSSQNPSDEPDFVYQFGTNNRCMSNKVGTSPGGVEFFSFSGGTINFSSTQRNVLFKFNVANYAALNARGATGMIVYIGSGTTTDRWLWYLHGNDTYPIAGGWVFPLINPDIAGYRDATEGSPGITAIDYFAMSADFSATSKSENVMFDALDYFTEGTGLTLIGGDGASADGTFQDFIDFDEGTVTNRHGIVRTKDGILYVLAVLTVGTATETDFTDSNQVIVFPDTLTGAGSLGMDVGLQNASSVFALSDSVFIGKGTKGGTTDTRPDFGIIGTSGSGSMTGCTFNVFRNWVMTSVFTLTDCKFLAGELLTQAGGVIDGGIFSGGTGTHYIISDDPGDILNCVFTQGASGHAVRCDTTGTYDWENNFDNGYTGSRGTNLVSSSGSTDAAFYNNSGGLITLNVTAGGQSPSVRNGAGATTQVNASTQITFDKMKDNTEVRVYLTSDGSEVAGIENATAGSTDNRNFVWSADSGTDVFYVLHNFIDGGPFYKSIRVEGFIVPSTDTTIDIQQILARNVS